MSDKLPIITNDDTLHLHENICCGTHKLKELEKEWLKDDEYKKLHEKFKPVEENGCCYGMKDKRDGWISTYTGKKFYVFNPNIDDIDIIDIARALSMICRFNGHVKRFYSVAQHSVLVSKLVSPEIAMEGLLHDATESIIGDMIRPVKRFMVEFKDVENKLEQAIAEKFKLDFISNHNEIKKADNIALVTEARDLLTTQVIMDSFDETIKPIEKRIKAQKPEMAEQRFLERYYELNGARNGSGTKRSFTL